MFYEFLIALLMETVRTLLAEKLASHVRAFGNSIQLRLRRKKYKVTLTVRTHERVRERLIHRMRTDEQAER